MAFDISFANPGAGTFDINFQAGEPPATTGYINVWMGSAWVAKPVKVWNGSSWAIKPVKYWNGSSWITAP